MSGMEKPNLKEVSILRIAIATFEYPVYIGGGGVYSTLVTQKLADLGEDVHVFSVNRLQKNMETPKAEMSLHEVPTISSHFLFSPSYWSALWFKIRKVAKQSGPFDVLLSMGIAAFGLPKRSKSWKMNVCSIFHLSQVTANQLQPDISTRLRWLGGEVGLKPILEKRCIAWADRIITLSEFTKKEIIRTHKKSADSIAVIPPAIPPRTESNPESFSANSSNRLKLGEDNNILFVGRVYYRKRIDFLLRSFKMLLETVDAKLWVVGPGDLDMYRRLAKELGISQHVILTGVLDEQSLWQLYEECEVFAFPSINEGFGFVLIEAMISGLPIVACNNTSIPDVVKDCGILVDSNNQVAFADAMKFLLEHPEERRRMGEAGVERVKRKYSDWNDVAKRMRDFCLEHSHTP